jgi:hypothetical protein
MELEEAIQQKMKEAKGEYEKWKLLAPKACHRYCTVTTLNGHPALTMPFFPPVDFEQRKQALIPIQKKMISLAEKGYLYQRRDLRWRHFGIRWLNNRLEMDIACLDLGSLTETDDDIPTRIKAVTAQMEDLEKRMWDEPVAKVGIVLV